MKVKICGISDEAAVKAACGAGARFIGFVFHPDSPRYVTPERAGELTQFVAPPVQSVGLFVDPDDDMLMSTLTGVRLDMIQLHGDETSDRVREIRAKTGKPVMKAIRVSSEKDIAQARAFESVSDWLLFDAARGGSGQVFDWDLLKNYRGPKPWMLAGGLNAGNLASALSILRPQAVDVSSGVEDAPGKKNSLLIMEFIDTARKY